MSNSNRVELPQINPSLPTPHSSLLTSHWLLSRAPQAAESPATVSSHSDRAIAIARSPDARRQGAIRSAVRRASLARSPSTSSTLPDARPRAAGESRERALTPLVEGPQDGRPRFHTSDPLRPVEGDGGTALHLRRRAHPPCSCGLR